MKQNVKTKTLVLMGLLSAVLILMAYTPLGYLNIGPLAITFNTIPVALGALAAGPIGGAVCGGVFGLTSFLQCFGISKLGTALFAIDPALTAIQCFLPRILDGFCVGLIASILRKHDVHSSVCGAVSGFFAASLNTLFYMTSLIMLFGKSDIIMSYRESLAPNKNVFIFVIAFVGVNAVAEMVSSTILTGAIGTALSKAKLLVPSKA